MSQTERSQYSNEMECLLNMVEFGLNGINEENRHRSDIPVRISSKSFTNCLETIDAVCKSRNKNGPM